MRNEEDNCKKNKDNIEKIHWNDRMQKPNASAIKLSRVFDKLQTADYEIHMIFVEMQR